MKSNWGKRILSALLAFVLVLGYLPVSALAEQTTPAEETVETTVATVPETIPETQPETEPVTEPATEPETVPESTSESVPDEESDLLIDMEQELVSEATGAVIASGSCGNNLTWTLIDDRTLTISGSGAMKDYANSTEVPWNYKCSQIQSVTIEQGVTSIGSYAFHQCYNLNTVTIPNSVTSIGDRAFYYCKSLSSVTIPNSVTSIGEWAFFECSDLRSVTIPNSVTSIGEYAFTSCISLTSVTIPNSVTSIGDGAFYHCNMLSSVTIPASVTSIGDFTFYYCSGLRSVTIPNSVTSIGDSAFSDCNKLTSVTIPNSVTSIGDSAFCDCYSLTSVTIPASVTSIGDSTFYQCGLTSVTIPDSVTSIGGAAFDFCSSLSSVTIPNSVTSIGSSAFARCTNLKDVYYKGTEEQWGQITIDAYNSDLTNATIHYNSQAEEAVPALEASFGGHKYVLYDLSMTWTEAKNYCQKLGGHLVTITSAEEQAFLESILPDPCTKRQYWLGASFENGPWSWVTGEAFDYSNWDINQPDHQGGEYFLEIFNCSGDGGAYPATRYKWNDTTHDNISGSNPVVGADAIGFICEYDFNNSRIMPYPTTNPILVNASGRAFAYYMCEPEVSVFYTIDGQAFSTDSDANGMIQIPLGSFNQPGENVISVVFTKMGDEHLIPEIHFQEKVKVTPLSFKQEWNASMSTSVSAGLSGGVGIKLPALEAEATLGKVEGEIEGGHALSFSRERSEGKDSLEITAKAEVKGGAKVKSGVTGEVLNLEYTPVVVSVGAKSGRSGSYGIKFEDYSATNVAQQQAVATFLLGEALVANPNNLLLKPFYEFLTESVYAKSGCIITKGSGTGINVSGGADLLKLKVNNTDLFTTATGKASAAISMSESTSSDGERSKKASYKLDATLAALSGKLGSDEAHLKGSVLSRDFLGTDISIAAKIDKEGKKSIATSFLSSSVSEPKFLILGAHTQSEYGKYSFEDDALNGLLSQSKYFNDYLNGRSIVLNQIAILKLADALSTCDMPIPYSNEYKDELLYTLPFEFGLALGFKADLGVELSYLEESSYVNKTGFAVDDRQMLTGVSDDLSKELAGNSWKLTEIFTNCVKSLANSAKNFFNEVTGAIKDGVQDAWSWVTENADSAKDWIITITSASSTSVWAESYSIDAYADNSLDTLWSESTYGESVGNYELTKAATIGRPFLISVTDQKGNQITDLSEEPLTYTIRYAEEDLQAAGLSSYSSIVRNGGIAMYRHSDEGDYFEFVGGSNDLEAMTVTATITKPGQYILAVDSCAPELSELDVSDCHTTTPTITAHIADFTGLDMNRFQFMLDGQCVVDGNTISEYFNPKTGTFTYTVPENAPLAEGEHTMSFALSDTSGNAQTYSFRFLVDLTMPEITQYSAEGHPNEGSIVEIKAQVSDANLSEVCALFSLRLPNSEWTEEAQAQMMDLGDGNWGLDYEGSGSSIRVRIQATDIAGNTTESDTVTLNPLAESVSLSQEYILLYPNQTTTLQAEVTPIELADAVVWSVENPDGTEVVSIDASGEVTAKNVGTAYILATVQNEEAAVTARCRVDVAEPTPLEGVQLGTTALTTELFRTDYAEFDVILLMEQLMSAQSVDEEAPEDNGVAIQSARFENEAMGRLFNLVVKDDRTLQVVPTEEAIHNSGSVGKSYSGKVIVDICGTEFTTDTALKLTVKKSVPKLKVSTLTFNPFYTEQSQAIKLTGATVTGISRNTAMDTVKTSALPSWLNLSEKQLTLTDSAPLKSTSAKAYLLVDTEEWAIPTAVTVPVKLSYKAPGLKLSASSATFPSGEAFAESRGVMLKLLCTTKKNTLEGLNVSDIQAPKGFEILNFDRTDGSFILKPTETVEAGTKQITVSFFDTTQTVTLKLKVSTKAVSIIAKPSTVTLNSVIGDSAAIPLTASPADYQISGVNIRLTGSSGEAIAQDLLSYEYSNGFVIVSTVKEKDKTQPNTTYKLHISTKDTEKETVLTVKTLADTAKTKPTVSARVIGSVDLSFPESCAVVIPAFKNLASGAFKAVKWTVTEFKGKTQIGNATSKFNITPIPEKNQLQLSAKDGLVPGNTYLVSLTYTLADDSTCSCTAKITVKRTPVKLKLSKTSLSLNRKIGDIAVVDVTCLTKGYEFTQPIAKLILPTEKDGQEINLSQPGTQEPLTVSWSDSKLTVTANSTAEAGKTYKIVLKATENDPAATLSVKILDTAVIASLKARGTIDVVRDSTAITVTPTYKNYMGLSGINPQLTIESWSGKKGEAYQEVENSPFSIVRNENGSYTIAKASDAAVDTTLRYRAKLTFDGGAQPAYCNLTVKSGTAKVAVSGTPVLYKADRFSRGTFRLTTADKTLNSIVKAEIRDAKYRDMFEIHSYGNGEYAIGFMGNKVPDGKLPTKVVLNVYADGNPTKSVASVTLKLQVR